MAGGVVGELVNGVMWGAGISMGIAAVLGVAMGYMYKDVKLDPKAKDIISKFLA